MKRETIRMWDAATAVLAMFPIVIGIVVWVLGSSGPTTLYWMPDAEPVVAVCERMPADTWNSVVQHGTDIRCDGLGLWLFADSVRAAAGDYLFATGPEGLAYASAAGVTQYQWGTLRTRWLVPHWGVVAVASVVSLIIIGLSCATKRLAARWRERASSRPERCRRCRYILTGNVSGACPECGAKIVSRGSRGLAARGAVSFTSLRSGDS